MIYTIDFTEKAIADIEYFNKSGQLKLVKKISELIKSISINPFKGIGKPEQLKHNFKGLWSRRISQEHRLIYKIIDDKIIIILAAKGHYL